MDVIKKFTGRNLVRNKKRTIVTIIGVMLSTALICTVVGMVATFRHSIVEDYKQTIGDYHVQYGIRNEEQYEILMNNAHVVKAGVVQSLGFSELDPEKTGKKYLAINGLNDTAFSQLNVKLKEGRLPENDSEMIISEQYASREGAPKIGEQIRLTVGNRFVPGMEGEEDIPYYGWDSAEDEYYLPREEKEYRIVGIIEENYAISGSGSYTAVVRDETYRGNYTHVFVRFDEPQNFSEYMSGISQAMESTGEHVDFTTNILIRYEGGFSDTTMKMVLMLGIIISLIIVGTSVFVISNGFRISVEDKKVQLGMLASIGATKRQIRRIVLREGMIIFLIGTSAGIALGALVIWILDQVVNLLMKDMVSIGMIYTFPLWVVVFSVALSAVTIFLACILPARRAARISPMEIIRGNGEIRTDRGKLGTGRNTKKFFGIGGVIAEKNLRRSRRKYRTTVVSLVIGIATFIAIASFVGYGKKLVGEVYSEYDCNLEVSIYGGDEEELDLQQKRETYEMIRRLPGVRGSAYAVGTDGVLSVSKWASEEYEERVSGFSEDDGQIDFEILLLPKNDFAEYLSRLGITAKDPDKVAILADRDIYYDLENDVKKVGRRSKIKAGDEVEFSYVSELIELTDAEREAGFPDRVYGKSTCRVEKIVEEGELPLGYNGVFSENSGMLLFLSEEHFKELPSYRFLLPLYIEAVNAESLERVINAMKVQGAGDDAGFRVLNIEAERQRSNRMILVLEIFLYGFLIVIVLIGLTNVVNTINTNMNLRSREFAMLRSVGMTGKEFTRMIRLEGIMYSLRSLVIGIPLGILLSGLIYLAIRNRVDYGYSVPWAAVGIAVLAEILIVWLIMWTAMRRIRKQNIIETIRKQNY